MRGVPDGAEKATAAAGGVGAAAGAGFEAATQGFSQALASAGGMIEQYAPAFVRDLVPFISDLAVGVL